MSDMTVLVTGAKGFVGKNLCAALRQRPGVTVTEIDLDDSRQELERALDQAHVVFHLAGVNRPQQLEEFQTGNVDFTNELLGILERQRRKPKVVLSSSVQAELENPYGLSKLGAEQALRLFCDATGAEGVVYRLKNLFGKWCRPNYNSVVATFCNNIALGLPIQVANPANVIDLTYVVDVVAAFEAELDAAPRPGFRMAAPLPSHEIALGELVKAIEGFRSHRSSLILPDYSSPFTRALYATYLSYLPPREACYQLDVRSDNRGSLAEFIKSPHFGQIFVSRTKPGITRGNHFHQTKTEKFMVVQGEGAIRLRQIHSDDVVEFQVKGEQFRVVDIPPGYTHSIENVGSGEMVTLFWSSEVFEQARPDTTFDPVIRQKVD